MVRGKLLDTDEDRETLLGLLLENVGPIAPFVWATRTSGGPPSQLDA